jgi:hypothetical protein
MIGSLRKAWCKTRSFPKGVEGLEERAESQCFGIFIS